jgi:hypothetical protein
MTFDAECIGLIWVEKEGQVEISVGISAPHAATVGRSE